MIFYEYLRAVVEPGLKNAFCLTEMGWDGIYYWYWCCKWKCHLLNDFWINQYFQFFNLLVFLSHVCICNPCESHTAGMSLDRIEQYFEAGIYFCCSHVWQFCLRIVTDENFSCIVTHIISMQLLWRDKVCFLFVCDLLHKTVILATITTMMDGCLMTRALSQPGIVPSFPPIVEISKQGWWWEER